MPPPKVMFLSSMTDGLQVIQNAYGHPLVITSGYRSPQVNKAIELANGDTWHPDGRHIHGDAVDISVKTGCNTAPKPAECASDTWWALHDLVRDQLYPQQACIEPPENYIHFHVDLRPWNECSEEWRQ